MSPLHLFGTDGMRGTFGRPPLDEPTVRRLGAALAEDLGARFESPTLVIGGDTRDSTPILCSWLASELASRGVGITFVGMLTTPGITRTVIERGASCGIAVSASHNPYPDNGIKLIDHRGFKWQPEAEGRLETAMRTVEPTLAACRPLSEDHAAVRDYLDALRARVAEPGERPLDGAKIALDTGYGAASPYARELFEGLGAEVVMLHDRPTGVNINQDSGSTHTEAIREAVRERGCDLGFAFDGDADRAVMIDGHGEERDGDAILYLWARDLHARGLLPGPAIVATSMSNLGLEVGLRRHGIDVLRCGVGDREVVSTMVEKGLVLGGEQSGHIVHLESSTTGDGLLTALALATLVRRSDADLDGLLDGFERFPQLLRNLKVARKPPLDSLPAVQNAARTVEEVLGDEGRLVLRYSGTEPLVRIMIEGPDQAQIESLADDLATVLEKELCV